MATLISIATGNFTSSSTWATVDATSLLDSEAASTASTTSYVYSSTFQPGAITLERPLYGTRASFDIGTVKFWKNGIPGSPLFQFTAVSYVPSDHFGVMGMFGV